MNYRTRWHRPLLPALPKALADWLVEPGSLTRQLQACFDDISVRVLRQGWHKPEVSEARLLQQPLAKYAFHREVSLQTGDTPLIYARTVVPAATYAAKPQRFIGLGNRPLGEMLFNDPTMIRGPIHVAKLTTANLLYQSAAQVLPQSPTVLWARRSCFYLDGLPILVNEVFLPSEKWSFV